MPIVNSAGAYILTKTASSSATIDFTDLPAGFKAFEFVISGLAPATDGADFWIRTSNGTGGAPSFDAGASDYSWCWFNSNDAAGSGADGNTSTTRIIVMTGLGNAANELSAYRVRIYNPSAAQFCHINYSGTSTNTAGVFRQNTGGGRRKSAAAVNAIRFMMDTGNIATGSFTIYGM